MYPHSLSTIKHILHSLQAIANVAWALATLGHNTARTGAFVERLLGVAEINLPAFTAQVMSAHPCSNYFQSKSNAALVDPLFGPPPSPQNLSNILWALAKMEPCCRPHPATLESYLDASLSHVQDKIHTFKPQELCNTIWALATLGRSSRFVSSGFCQGC